MTEPAASPQDVVANATAPSANALSSAAGSALAALAHWRSTLLPSQDPVRWHFLEVLAERLNSAPETLQVRLAQGLQQALDTLTTHGTTPLPPAAPQPYPSFGLRALARLNQQLHHQTGTVPPPRNTPTGTCTPAPAQPRMRSLQGFQATWARVHADQQLHQALDRAPDQAGPLNSHKLVLRSLALLRDLSPDYTRRLMAQWDDLLWLEQAHSAQPGKSVRASRSTVSKK